MKLLPYGYTVPDRPSNHIKCYKFCEHYQYPDYVLSKALDAQQRLTDQHKGSAETVAYSVDRDLTGSIAQLSVNELLRSWPYDVQTSDPYESDKYGDRWDFFYDGKSCDVMGQKYGKLWSVGPKIKVYCFDHKRKRPMDRYVFAFVDQSKETVHIAGTISKEGFWQIAKPDEGNKDKPEREWRSWITVGDLERSLRSFIFGTPDRD